MLLRHTLCLCIKQIKGSFHSSLVSNRASGRAAVPEHCCDIRGAALIGQYWCSCVCVCVLYRGQTRGDRHHRSPGHAHPGDFPMGCHHQHHCGRTGMRFTHTHTHTHTQFYHPSHHSNTCLGLKYRTTSDQLRACQALRTLTLELLLNLCGFVF